MEDVNDHTAFSTTFIIRLNIIRKVWLNYGNIVEQIHVG